MPFMQEKFIAVTHTVCYGQVKSFITASQAIL